MVTNQCLSCNDLFKLNSINQVIFCNGTPGKFIDQYHNKKELYQEFFQKEIKPSLSPENQACIYSQKIPSQDLQESKVNQALRDFCYDPQRMFCYVHFRCNNNCLYCLVGSEKKTFPNPDFEQLIQFIDQYHSQFKIINLVGGEPSLYPEIIELIQYVKEKKCWVQMFSNGRLFARREFANKLVKAGLDQVTITIHSHIPQIHDAMTQRKGSFFQMQEGIENLLEAGIPYLHAMIVIHKKNYQHLLDICKTITMMSIDHLSLEAMTISGDADLNREEVAIPLSATKKYLWEAVDFLIQERQNFSIGSIPACFFKPSHWKYLSNSRYYTLITNWDSVKKMLKPQGIEKTAGLSLSTKCVDCLIKKICPGTWLSYLNTFGESELQPFV